MPETFQNHCYRLVLALTPEDVADFGQLTSDRDRATRMLHLTREVPEVEVIADVKSAKIASQDKEIGNDCYKQRKFADALRAYNDCIVRCPTDDQGQLTCALTLANKAAVYYELKQYRKCIDCCLHVLDVYKAVYPTEKVFRLHSRLAKAYQHIGDCQIALKHFKLAHETLINCDLSDKERSKECKLLNQQTIDFKPPDENCDVKIKKDINNLKKRNPDYQCAHSSVAIGSDSNLGRYAIAKADIPTGTVVLKEKPYAAILSEEHVRSNCNYCSISCNVLIPCPHCTCAVFCSRKCFDMASAYHKNECAILNTLYTLKSSINALLAMRMVTMRLFDFSTESDNVCIDICTNVDRRNLAELIPFSAMSILILRLLHKVRPDISNKTIDDVTIGAALLLYLQQLQFNAHELSELRPDTEGNGIITPCRTVGIGAAIYPTLSLFNHSCEPTISRYNAGREIVVRTIKPLRKGDMIYENYGPMYLHKGRDERQTILSKWYLFDCVCAPCTHNWPLYDMIVPKSRSTIGCKKCGGFTFFKEVTAQAVIPCANCKEPIKVLQDFTKIAKAIKNLTEADSEMANGKFVEAFRMYCGMLDQLKDYFDHPRADVINIQEQIKLCIAQFGNKSDNYDIHI